MNRLWAPGAIALAVLVAVALFANDAPAAQASHMCGATGSPKGPFDLQTYEASNWRTTYRRTLSLAAFNRLFPEVSGFAPPSMEKGGRAAGSDRLTDPYIPPTLLRAIAWIESSWIQADYSVPYGAVGPVLVSHDCGYGIMQVTSGMQNDSGLPSLTQAMIGGHFGFNIARGARILANKWNMAPEFRPLVGNRNSAKLEHWYYAVWSYNGFAYSNHPSNPVYNPQRSAYRCDGTQSRSNYPYQELIFGCVAKPPEVNGNRLWSPRQIHLPKPSEAAFVEPLSLSNWSACAVNLQCAAMDMPSPNPSHTDPTTTSATRSEVLGSPKLKISATQHTLTVIPTVRESPALTNVRNKGTGVLAWYVTVTKPWLRVSRYQGVALGSDLGTRKGSFIVTADVGSLKPGVYTGKVKVQSLYASKAPAVINVTLHVSGMHKWILQTGTPLGETDRDMWSFVAADFNGDGRGDLIAVRMNGTGCGKTEVHVLSGASKLQKWLLNACTPLEPTQPRQWSFAAGDWDKDGVPDLIAIKKKATGCNGTEVHILSGASKFNRWLLRDCTSLNTVSSNQWSFEAADYDRDGVVDLVGIKKNGTGCNRTEVHILSGASKFKRWLLQECTGLQETQDSLWAFAMGDYEGDGRPDLYGILMKNTGTNTTEVHVLSGASRYGKFTLHAGSALHTTTRSGWFFDVVRYNRNRFPDLVSVKMNQTAGGFTEAHIIGW